ncbi:MAG: hypothetical protein ACE5JX_04510 [Acidobacteriota bacterium]
MFDRKSGAGGLLVGGSNASFPISTRPESISLGQRGGDGRLPAPAL